MRSNEVHLILFYIYYITLNVSSLSGDLSGTLHITNYTILNAVNIGPSINASLLVYPLGEAHVPKVISWSFSLQFCY